MISTIQLVVTVVAIYLSGVTAQTEIFEYDVGTGRRAGKASLRIEPDLVNGRSDITFTTKQAGVGHTNKLRLALQWITNKADPAQLQWSAVVFQLRVPQGGGSENPAIERIMIGKNYDRYVKDAQIWTNDEYVDLVLVDYDQQVTIDTTNEYRGAGDTNNYKVTDSNVVVGTDTFVELKLSAPYLDPVGDNQFWFKWMFYNDDPACDTGRFENYCFARAPIDGQKAGYVYTTYTSWSDFFVKGEVMTFYWIMFAFSLFWIFGQAPQVFLGFCLQFYMIIKAWIGYANALKHINVEQYQGEITTMILSSFFFTFFASTVMVISTTFIFFGPLLNLASLLLISTYIDNIDVYI